MRNAARAMRHAPVDMRTRQGAMDVDLKLGWSHKHHGVLATIP